MTDFVKRVEEDIVLRDLIPSGSGVVAAVSGGADSVALLLVLCELADRYSWRIHVAHFDHAMRPDSREDTQFVASLCRRLGVEINSGRSSVLTPGASEAEARRERLSFLSGVAEKVDCCLVATGHTAGDRAETVLLNLVRGSGLRGLTGIRWSRGVFVRPLLGRMRREVEAFLVSRGQSWREDPTNASDDYIRNSIRHHFLPGLEQKVNPNAVEALCRFADLAAIDEDYLRAEAQRMLPMARKRLTDRELVLNAAALRTCASALAHRMVLMAIQELNKDLQDVSSKMVDRVLAMAHSTSAAMDIGLNISASSSAEEIRLCKPLPAIENYDYDLPLSGAVDISEVQARVLVMAEPPVPNGLVVRLSLPAGRPHVRNWRHGDRMRFKGLNGTKKLQDIFVDAKVPVHQRRRLPLVCVDNTIVWVPGLAVAEPVAGGVDRYLMLEAAWYTK